MSKLIHLSGDQQQELLQLIDEFQSCFNETPGYCPYKIIIVPCL